MKNSTLVIAALLLTLSLPLFANASPLAYDTEPVDRPMSKLFLFDYENKMMFVDFAVFDTPFEAIVIIQNNAVVKSEDVSDLPTSTIYEVNFDELEKGINYTLELTTVDGITIRKDFVIN